MTTRPQHLADRRLPRADAQLFRLDDRPAENREDVREYIRRRAARPGLRAWCKERRLRLGEFVDRLAEKSEDNFMYLRYVLRDLERGGYYDLSMSELPRGLQEYYATHWRRMRVADRADARTSLLVANVLARFQRPLSRADLCEITGHGPPIVQGVLNSWREFLDVQDAGSGVARYAIYHSSFRDFLQKALEQEGLSIDSIDASIDDTLHEWLDLLK